MDNPSIKMNMNSFGGIAVEEAILLKDKVIGTKIFIAVSCGLSQCQGTLRITMAIGADRAILIECQDELQPLAECRLWGGKLMGR